MSFELHPQLEADTHFICDLKLCRVLLMDDANYPWVIHVPRRNGIREICELLREDQHQLTDESAQVARAMLAIYKPDKLNIAALGNQVSQLHIHHIARFTTDAAWPNPVWGHAPRKQYTGSTAAEAISRLRRMLEVAR